MMRACLIVTAITVCAHFCHAQEQPAVDRKDPAAVVAAYLRACEAQEIDAAMALADGNAEIAEAVAAELREFLEAGMRPHETFVSVFMEFSLLPAGIELAPADMQTAAEGDTATVTMMLGRPVRATFVLLRDADGNWGIDIEKTILGTTGFENSLILGEIRRDMGVIEEGWEEGEGPNEDRELRENRLRTLAALLRYYAREHDDTLPPAESWRDDVERFCLDKTTRLADLEEGDADYGCAINAAIAGKALPEDRLERGGIVILFECADPSRNAAGDPLEDLLYIEDGDPPAFVATASGVIAALPPDVAPEETLQAWRDYATSTRRLEALCKGLLEYARDNDGFLPPADSWCDDIMPYLKPEQRGPDTFRCPRVPEFECAYAINEELADMDVTLLQHHHSHVLLLPAAFGARNESRQVPAVADEGRHVASYHAEEPEPRVLFGQLNGWIRLIEVGEPYPAPPEFDELGGPPGGMEMGAG